MIAAQIAAGRIMLSTWKVRLILDVASAEVSPCRADSLQMAQIVMNLNRPYILRIYDYL